MKSIDHIDLFKETMTSDRPNSNCPQEQLERKTSPENSEVRLTPVGAAAESTPTLVLLGQVAEDVAALRKEVAALTAMKEVFDNLNDGFLSLKDAACYVGLSSKQFRRLMNAGKFLAHRLPGGGSLRFRKADLDKAIIQMPLPGTRKD